MIRFHDGSGDPKMLTVSQETGTDNRRYIEFEMEIRDEDGCLHSFWLSDLDTMDLIQFLQRALGPL